MLRRAASARPLKSHGWLPLIGRVGSHGARAAHGAGSSHRSVVVGSAHGRGAAGTAVAAVTKVLLTESCEALLLGDSVDVGADDEANDVEEGDPELVREELLGKGQADGRGDPRNAHHLPEANLDSGADLVVCAGASNQGHGDQVDAVLDGSNNQVADDDLHDLGAQAGAALEEELQQPDEEVAQRRADEGTVGGHLGDTGRKVVAMLVAVLGHPRSKELLQTSEGARGQHLCPQRVLLELVDVGSEVSLGAGHAGATGQGSADSGSDGVLAAGAREGTAALDGIRHDLLRLLDGLAFELDRHGGRLLRSGICRGASFIFRGAARGVIDTGLRASSSKEREALSVP
jgi:hypothetical protein